MITSSIRRCIRLVKVAPIYAGTRIFGISFLVRHLRNPNPQLTVSLLRAFGAEVGQRTTIKRSLFLDNTYEDADSTGDLSNIRIGNNCYIGDCVYFDLSNQIIMEDNVVVSGRVSVLTHADCNRSEYLAEKFPRKSQPVRICSGAWIGFNATILPGSTVGRCSVVAANSLVRGDVEPKAVYAGVPAKKIRDLEEAAEELHPCLARENKTDDK